MFALSADIDMQGEGITVDSGWQSCVFAGVFKGNGFAVENISLAAVSEYEWDCWFCP